MSTENKHHKLQISLFHIVIDCTLVHFTYIFNVQEEISNLWYLVSVYTHILLSGPDDDPSSRSNLVVM